MKNANPHVDAYIARSPAYARPILTRIRRLFHQAFPAIEEAMKWNAPHFMHHGIVGGMAAFKQHVRFGFWKGKLLADRNGDFAVMGDTEMSASKITSLADLPSDRLLIAMIREAVKLNAQTADERANAPRKSRSTGAKVRKIKREVVVPADLRAALAANKAARATFEVFSYSHKKEYVEWITEAKREETRTKRLGQTIEWLSEGKPRNWKYMNC
jgi:uncharacterized protein YdeI (YjbR/CyaY-like superfamily)